MILDISSRFLDSLDKNKIRKCLNLFNKKCFRVNWRDSKCLTNVIIGNNFGETAIGWTRIHVFFVISEFSSASSSLAEVVSDDDVCRALCMPPIDTKNFDKKTLFPPPSSRANIRKLSFHRKKFLIKLHPEVQSAPFCSQFSSKHD